MTSSPLPQMADVILPERRPDGRFSGQTDMAGPSLPARADRFEQILRSAGNRPFPADDRRVGGYPRPRAATWDTITGTDGQAGSETRGPGSTVAAGRRPAAERSPAKAPDANHPSGSGSVEEQPVDQQPVDEQPVDDRQPVDNRPVGDHIVDGRDGAGDPEAVDGDPSTGAHAPGDRVVATAPSVDPEPTLSAGDGASPVSETMADAENHDAIEGTELRGRTRTDPEADVARPDSGDTRGGTVGADPTSDVAENDDVDPETTPVPDRTATNRMVPEPGVPAVLAAPDAGPAGNAANAEIQGGDAIGWADEGPPVASPSVGGPVEPATGTAPARTDSTVGTGRAEPAAVESAGAGGADVDERDSNDGDGSDDESRSVEGRSRPVANAEAAVTSTPRSALAPSPSNQNPGAIGAAPPNGNTESMPADGVAANAQTGAGSPVGDNADPLWQQVRRALGSLRTNQSGDQQLTIRLRPDDLGSVVVRISTGADGTAVSLIAESATAANQLNQQRQLLISELAGSGLRRVAVDVNTSDSSGGQAGGFESDPDQADSARGHGSTPAGVSPEIDPALGYRGRPDRGTSVGLIDLDL